MHLTASFDGATLKIYVNGVLEGSMETPGLTIPANTVPFTIGAEDDGDTSYHGAVDDVRLFDRALTDSEIQLVLAGPRDSSADMPWGDDVHDLGILEHSDVAKLYSALDLGIICNLDSAFGRYCYPQKFFEILACGTPVIAAAVGTMHDMLENHPHALYRPGDPDSLAAGIQGLLANRHIPDFPIPDWETRASELETLMNDIF